MHIAHMSFAHALHLLFLLIHIQTDNANVPSVTYGRFFAVGLSAPPPPPPLDHQTTHRSG